MNVDAASAIDLSEDLLFPREENAHILDASLRQDVDGLLVDLPRARQPEELGGLRDVDVVHLETVLLRDNLARPLVYVQRAAREPVLFLELRVEHQQSLDVLRRAVLEALLEKVSRALKLAPAIPLDELRKVEEPEVFDLRPAEKRDRLLVDLEGSLPVVLLLE